MKKTTEELIQEFLDNGGVIEKITSIDVDRKYTITSTTKKTPELISLAEGELMFGETQKRTKKVKEPDFSGINLDLIPEHLHNIIKKSASDKQNEDHKGGTTSETN